MCVTYSQGMWSCEVPKLLTLIAVGVRDANYLDDDMGQINGVAT